MTTPSPVGSHTWPAPRKSYAKEAKETVGVYGLYTKLPSGEEVIYVGMTVSSGGFAGRWSKHHRNVFVKKRATATTKRFRTFVKENALTSDDFSLLVLEAWPNPRTTSEEATRALTDAIALRELYWYNYYLAAGHTMLNNIVPRGTGYTVSTRPRRRRTRRPAAARRVSKAPTP